MKLDLKFSSRTIGADLGSGLTVALVSIPEGMAYAIVAVVDPIYGLYTGMVTTVVAALTGSWRTILGLFGDWVLLAQALFVVIVIALGYFLSTGDRSVRKATAMIEPGSNSGPVFAAIAIAFNNDPVILGITTALIFVQIVVGTLVGSYLGKGDGEEEGAPVESPAEAESTEAAPA